MIAALILSGLFSFRPGNLSDAGMVAIRVRPEQVRFFWKDDRGRIIGSLAGLRQFTGQKGMNLLFAMNGGMYQEDQSPLGCYVEKGRMLKPLNRRSGSGNFYLQPNGVCYIDAQSKGHIVPTAAFAQVRQVKYATQSGPMLVTGNRINPLFTKGSANLNVRNGVGVLPDGSMILAMSRTRVNFYEFAEWFRAQGCRDALYLDGFVSRAYYPAAKWLQTDGAFGVMIGVFE